MKYIYILALLVFTSISIKAQVSELILDEPLSSNFDATASTRIVLKPGFKSQGYSFSAGVTNEFLPPSQGGTPTPYEAASPSSTKNYVLTKTYREPIKTISNNPTITNQHEIIEEINYFDGLGRALQSIQVNASPTGKDIVKHTIYDDLGRVSQNYLPFSLQNIPGAFVENLFDEYNAPDEISNHYNLMHASNPSMEANAFPYSETVFDGSPLNRVMKQGAPGADWQPDNSTPNRQSTEHVVSYEFSTETFKKFEVNSSNNLKLNSNYYSGKVYVTITTDENGNISKEFKNKSGQVLLKRSFLEGDNLDTYYVYDDFGLLRYVLPPMTSDIIDAIPASSAEFTLSSTSWLADYCYYYQYDEKQRMVEKKLPGVEPVYMLYDNRDRLILTQDGNQRQHISNKYWLFTKYDELNRPIMTGEICIDVGTVISEANKDQSNWTESRTGSSDYTLIFPFTVLASQTKVFTKTYYDDYNYPGKLAFEAASCIGVYDGPFTNYEQATKGMVTGTKNCIGENSSLWEISTPYYDEYGRVIWNKRTVQFETGNTGSEITSTKYLFSGEAEQIKQIQTLNGVTTTVDKFMEYDHVGRLKLVAMEVNGTNREVLAEYYYNELGEIQEKHLANNLQNINYEYNSRGWLTKMNNSENIGDDLFAMELLYNNANNDHGFTSSQYNGNISAMIWKYKLESSYSDMLSYEFDYDELNRLTKADYGFQNAIPGGYSFSKTNDYNVAIGLYDANGNIKSLSRQGSNGTGFDQIDNLTYTYSGNQLTAVKDDATGTKANGFNDGLAGNATTEYTYDRNGNLKSDANKNITNIYYNHLNLPTSIQTWETPTTQWYDIMYTYTATGEKLMKTTVNSKYITDITKKRYYFSNFEYDNTMSLEYIHTSEGRVRYDGSNFHYDYYLKDHLGNTRVVFTDEDNDQNPEVLQVSNYYPFGMRHGQSNTFATSKTTQYMYNGKELQEDFGLNWMSYGAREYDGALGRFMTLDPKSEWYYPFSPYGYVANNPISNIDYNGEFIVTACVIVGVIIISTAGANLAHAPTQNPTQDQINIDYYQEKQVNAYKIGAAIASVPLILPDEESPTEEPVVREVEEQTQKPEPANMEEDGFTNPQSEDDKSYQKKDQKRAPEQSTPYDTKEKQNEKGEVKQVTTYDENGRRHKQYDLNDGRREEHQHSFEYNEDYPKGKRSKEHEEIK